MRSTGSKWLFSFTHLLPLLLLAAVALSSLAAARVQDAPAAAAAEPDVFSPIKATQLAHAAARDDYGRWAVHAPHHKVGSGAGAPIVQPPLAPPPLSQEAKKQHLPHEPPRLADHSQSSHHHAPLASDSATLGESVLDRVIRWTMWTGYGFWCVLVWIWHYCLAAPILGAWRLTRYSAEGTWRTTTWAGDRAVWRPVRTVAAPLVYLVQGLLFLFVLTPYAVIQRLVRELYPI